jgi:lipid II:glycine glycyltransferase (peptidoglycan interpeptide bridge formation enzyme)
MPLVSLSEWNQFIARYPNAHLLQTGEWGELKSSFGWRVLRVVNGDFGVQILLRPLPMGYSVAYIPKPVSFDGSQWVDEPVSLCRNHKAIFLKIEQDQWSLSGAESIPILSGFRLSPHSIQPRRTIIVDIRGSEEEVLNRMKQKCRYNIRLAEKKGVTIRPWNDIHGFHDLIKKTGERDGFGVHSVEYYDRVYGLFHPEGLAEILVAEFDGRPLAALMVFARGQRAWYLYGASSDLERNRMPAYLLQWEAMRWARSKGAEEYDLWGIPDEDEDTLEAEFESRQDGLWGVYRFKRGFGGRILRAAPAMDKVFNPLLYKFYLWRMSGMEMG